jgi:large conductance mechanosensitive channel
MSGFKSFVLKGNLVDLAVAVIVGTAFGFFLNAVIAFLTLAAVVYFFVVVPYTKAKDKYFPDAPEGDPADIALLTEIRDLLKR